VPPEFRFDICIAEEACLRFELLAVDAEDPAVEGNWREEAEWRRFGARFEGDGRCGGGGEEADSGAHRHRL